MQVRFQFSVSLELIVQEGLHLVGAELYGELEDKKKSQCLEGPGKLYEALLKTIEPSFTKAMYEYGEHEDGYPERSLGNEGWDAFGVELGEHAVQIVLSRGEVEATEEDPCEHDEHLTQKPAGNLHPPTMRGEAVQKEPLAPLVHHKAEAVQGSPENEHQRASVPQTCHHHGDEVVEVGAKPSPFVTSHGDVEIIPEPCRERNVPTTPKL